MINLIQKSKKEQKLLEQLELVLYCSNLFRPNSFHAIGGWNEWIWLLQPTFKEN